MRVFLGLAGVVLGIFVNLSSALAELSEDVGRNDANTSDYLHKVLPRELMVQFLIDDNDALTEDDLVKYYSFITGSYNNASPVENIRQPTTRDDELDRRVETDSLDAVSAPEAVWSLDVSTGSRLDYNAGRFGLGLDMVFGNYYKIIYPDFGEHSYPWILNYTTSNLNMPLVAPPQFQVASCNGHAERPNMDYCSTKNDNAQLYDNNSGAQRYNNINFSNNLSNDVNEYSENFTQVNNQIGGSAGIVTITQSIPGDAVNIEWQDINAIINLCYNNIQCVMFMGNLQSQPSNPIVPIDAPIIPIETPPDVPPPPIFVGDPPPIAGPPSVSTPPIVSSSVPETSTWIMTMIGFSVVIGVGKRRTIRQGVFGSIFKFAARSFRGDTGT